MYRQDKKREYVQVETAGHYAKENEVKMADGTIGYVDLSHGGYCPRRATHYRANNQRPAEKRRNIRLHSKH